MCNLVTMFSFSQVRLLGSSSIISHWFVFWIVMVGFSICLIDTYFGFFKFSILVSWYINVSVSANASVYECRGCCEIFLGWWRIKIVCLIVFFFLNFLDIVDQKETFLLNFTWYEIIEAWYPWITKLFLFLWVRNLELLFITFVVSVWYVRQKIMYNPIMPIYLQKKNKLGKPFELRFPARESCCLFWVARSFIDLWLGCFIESNLCWRWISSLSNRFTWSYVYAREHLYDRFPTFVNYNQLGVLQ